MKYHCEACGCVAEAENMDVVRETHGFRYPPFEEFLACPRCGSPDYLEEVPDDYGEEGYYDYDEKECEEEDD